MRTEELETAIGYLERAAARIAKHSMHGMETHNIMYARDEIERAWTDLTPTEQKAMRKLDRVVLREYAWILKEDPFLGTSEAPPGNVDRHYWWWFLGDIQAGRMEPPADLKGAA